MWVCVSLCNLWLASYSVKFSRKIGNRFKIADGFFLSSDCILNTVQPFSIQDCSVGCTQLIWPNYRIYWCAILHWCSIAFLQKSPCRMWWASLTYFGYKRLIAKNYQQQWKSLYLSDCVITEVLSKNSPKLNTWSMTDFIMKCTFR